MPRTFASIFLVLSASAAISVVVLIAGELAAMQRPAPRYGIDEAILEGQMERAEAGVEANVLLTGDSSGLVGVNAWKLGEMTGEDVQSLATMGNVGPSGWGSLLARSQRRNAGATTVIVLIHGDAVKRQLSENAFERAAIDGRWPRAPFGQNLRQRFWHDLGYFAHYPLPGAWGRAFGSAEGLRDQLQQGHGTIMDPTDGVSCPQEDYVFGISQPVAGRMADLAQAIALVAPERVLIGMTPIPERCVGEATDGSRDALSRTIADMLSIPAESILDLPLALPDESFAGFTHLNAKGRETLTRHLAAALSRRFDEEAR